MPIYTKKGDKGETKTITKNPLSKDDKLVEALGALDELNSFLGLTNSFSTNPNISEFINDIQNDLFTLSSILAGSALPFPEEKTYSLEKKIDELDNIIPPIQNFIFVSGTMCAVHLQYARALARRAERRLVAYSKISEVSNNTLSFVNRLSDALFTLARFDNFQNGIKEPHWVSPNKK